MTFKADDLTVMKSCDVPFLDIPVRENYTDVMITDILESNEETYYQPVPPPKTQQTCIVLKSVWRSNNGKRVIGKKISVAWLPLKQKNWFKKNLKYLPEIKGYFDDHRLWHNVLIFKEWNDAVLYKLWLVG